jgi:GNAT superfamily N-acetyltransferase
MPSGDFGIVGVGTLTREFECTEAEFALLVADEYAGFGIGRELLRRLVETGRVESIPRIVGYILNENGPMLAVCRRLGFSIKTQAHDPMVIALDRSALGSRCSAAMVTLSRSTFSPPACPAHDPSWRCP